MACLQRMRVSFLLPLFLFSLHFAHAHRKISPTKLPTNRVLMGQSSTPSFYNAFDPSFHKPASMYSNHLNDKLNLDLTSNNINTNYRNFDPKNPINKGLSASLDSMNDAFYPNTYHNKYATNDKYDNNENFAGPTSDYKPDGGRFSHPRFSAPSISSQSSYGHNFPPSFEASLPNKESYSKESLSSSRQQSFYGSPSSEKSLYASSSNEQNMYSSPSNEKNLYASPSNERGSYSSSPSSNYKARYPFNANDSPSKPRVSEFDEFTKSHPVSNYDSFFNTPIVTKKLSPVGGSTFPLSDHDLTYGQVQVP